MLKNNIIGQLWNSSLLNDIIIKITSGHQLKDDLKSELFLILMEMKDDRIIKAHNNNYLIYMCINILKKQYHSKTSPFHKNFRKGWSDIVVDVADVADVEVIEDNEMIDKIRWIVDNKLDLVDRELFKLYYKWDRYDRWTGDLRDKECQKEMSSYRKIEKKLAVKGVDIGKVSISRSTIALSHRRSIDKIIKWLDK